MRNTDLKQNITVFKYIKRILSVLLLWIALTSTTLITPALSQEIKQKPDLHLGFGFYVGGLHILDAKAVLNSNTINSTYSFTALASTRGFTDWITGFMGKSTSSGILNADGSVKARLHTNTSYSNFGENYSELFFTKKGAKLVRYPDRNEARLANLNGNPLAKANDPVATLLNIMAQVGSTGKCAKNLIVVANHFLYKMKALKSQPYTLDITDLNVANGKAIACDLDFVRLDKEENFSAYNHLNQTGDGKDRAPVAYFKKIKGIPYVLPVMVSAKEENFGEFRMHLQYVKYGNVKIAAPVWQGDEAITAEKLNALKAILKKLGAK